MSTSEGIKAMMILDIIGKPAQHLVDTLEKMIEEMKTEKGVKVVSKNIREPVTIKDNKEFFTTFAEVELEVEDIMTLSGMMFKYMPAHIEVISPEKINLANTGWSDILSELVRRLHSYDEMTRIVQMENARLVAELQKARTGISVKEISENPEEKKNTGKKSSKKKK
ncbi:MAG: hypothetical protein ABSG05_01490 [Candidatus Pacearchaeota archaeon]|jgi:hypothetical protein